MPRSTESRKEADLELSTVTAAELHGAGPDVQRGPAYWTKAYWVMLRWQVASFRLLLPVTAAVQILAGVGLVLGFGLFFAGPMPPRSALFLTTGVTVINLYILGLVMCPQIIGQQKMEKTYEFVQSMPVPRAIAFLCWYSLALLVGTPALVISLAAGALRYHQTFQISAAVVPAIMLVSLCSVAIGYALGNALNQPMVTNVLTQVLNFFAIGFAPVCVPPEQFPTWLQAVNRALPFESMATVMRAALTGGSTDNVPAAYAVLGIWTILCLSIAGWSVMKRA